MIQDWGNRVKRDPTPSLQEHNEFAEAVGREFCWLPPEYNKIMSLGNVTSFLHTFDEAISAFYVFCQKMTEVMLWPVKLLRRKEQTKQRL